MARVRKITTADLPDDTTPGVSLYCPRCQSHYSATRGDYFLKRPDEPFRCTCSRGRPYLDLVQRHRAPLTRWTRPTKDQVTR